MLQVVARTDQGAMVKYCSPHQGKWSVDEQVFVLSETDLLQCVVLQGPEIVLQGNRCYYVFKVSVLLHRFYFHPSSPNKL